VQKDHPFGFRRKTNITKYADLDRDYTNVSLAAPLSFFLTFPLSQSGDYAVIHHPVGDPQIAQDRVPEEGK